jgi:hypothetical protein
MGNSLLTPKNLQLLYLLTGPPFALLAILGLLIQLQLGPAAEMTAVERSAWSFLAFGIGLVLHFPTAYRYFKEVKGQTRPLYGLGANVGYLLCLVGLALKLAGR